MADADWEEIEEDEKQLVSLEAAIDFGLANGKRSVIADLKLLQLLFKDRKDLDGLRKAIKLAGKESRYDSRFYTVTVPANLWQVINGKTDPLKGLPARPDVDNDDKVPSAGKSNAPGLQ